MPVVFSNHAKGQLKRRRISQNLAIKAVRNPNKIVPSFMNRKLRQIRVGGKILEIVTKTEGSKTTIITGYYLKG